MRKVDVVVVGAGQAGLATSAHLTRRGIEHVVLDKGRVAESWRTRRWDSFAINGPNWSFMLPGYQYDGPDPDGFMLRQELVDRFADYAHFINAPVEEGVEVTKATRDEASGGFTLTTSSGDLKTRALVAATGAYQRANRPQTGLAADVLQLSTDEYRNARTLPEGGVLVVGSGQSGCQVAEDLRDNGRDVWLATGTCGWIPRRYRGKDQIDWRYTMGAFDETVDQVGPEHRLTAPPIQTGVEGGRDINLATLRSRGIHLAGRLQNADQHHVTFADDLPANVASSDSQALKFRQRVDDYIASNELDAPPPEPFEPAGDFSGAPTTLDLNANNINTVIWAAGFRLDYGWIDLDLNLSAQRYPEQTWGVSPHTGLYFMGLQLMHTRKSGLIFGVGEDAEHVTGVIAQQLEQTS